MTIADSLTRPYKYFTKLDGRLGIKQGKLSRITIATTILCIHTFDCVHSSRTVSGPSLHANAEAAPVHRLQYTLVPVHD